MIFFWVLGRSGAPGRLCLRSQFDKGGTLVRSCVAALLWAEWVKGNENAPHQRIDFYRCVGHGVDLCLALPRWYRQRCMVSGVSVFLSQAHHVDP
jgi:hypothetical protein